MDRPALNDGTGGSETSRSDLVDWVASQLYDWEDSSEATVVFAERLVDRIWAPATKFSR